MSYTIGQLCVDVIKFVINNPRVLKSVIGVPVTRRKAKAAYNSQNSPSDFDTDFMARLRTFDPYYVSMSDTALQSLIDETMPLDMDITAEVNETQGGN